MLGTGRIFYKNVDSIPRVFNARPTVRHVKTSSLKREIVIPPRIQREPTDILKALASTVDVDHTAFHYTIPDDPYFYTFAQAEKRVYALSVESGRKSAEWIVKENPGFFKNKLSEPTIKAFLPEKNVNEADITQESLLDAIEERDVLGAIKTYKALKSQGTDVEKSVKQSLLELVCFYNCEERPDSCHLELKWLEGFLGRAGAEIKHTTKWDATGFAKSLFEEMDSGCPLANSAMILGMLKYGEYDQALQLYNSAIGNNVRLSVGVYNSLISERTSIVEDRNVTLEFVMGKLKEMSEAGLNPDLGTLNAALRTLSKSYRHATVMKLMREFESLGIRPSLGSYGYVLQTVGKLRNIESDTVPLDELTKEIMLHIENGEHEVLHPSDLTFLNNAMDSFVEGFRDADLALRLADFYLKPANRKFIVRAGDQHAFFKQLFLIVFKSKPIDEAMDMYRRFVFTTFVPESRVVTAVIAAIHENLVSDHLVELWKDIYKLGMSKNRMILGRILHTLEDFTDEAALKVFNEVAQCFMLKADEFMSGDELVLPKILLAFVKNDNDKGVSLVIDTLKKNELFLMHISESVVVSLFEYAMAKNNVPFILESLSMASNKEFPSTSEMAEKALPLLSGADEDWAKGLISKGKEENQKRTKEEESEL